MGRYDGDGAGACVLALPPIASAFSEAVPLSHISVGVLGKKNQNKDPVFVIITQVPFFYCLSTRKRKDEERTFIDIIFLAWLMADPRPTDDDETFTPQSILVTGAAGFM
jgi:hypothetical protein